MRQSELSAASPAPGSRAQCYQLWCPASAHSGKAHTHTYSGTCVGVIQSKCLSVAFVVFESFVIADNVDNCFKRVLVDTLVVLPLLRFVVLLLEIGSNIFQDRQTDRQTAAVRQRAWQEGGDRPMD